MNLLLLNTVWQCGKREKSMFWIRYITSYDLLIYIQKNHTLHNYFPLCDIFVLSKLLISQVYLIVCSFFFNLTFTICRFLFKGWHFQGTFELSRKQCIGSVWFASLRSCGLEESKVFFQFWSQSLQTECIQAIWMKVRSQESLSLVREGPNASFHPRLCPPILTSVRDGENSRPTSFPSYLPELLTFMDIWFCPFNYLLVHVPGLINGS